MGKSDEKTGGGCIRRCSCKQKFQDKKYGAQMRVHTWKRGKKECICTVCESKK